MPFLRVFQLVLQQFNLPAQLGELGLQHFDLIEQIDDAAILRLRLKLADACIQRALGVGQLRSQLQNLLARFFVVKQSSVSRYRKQQTNGYGDQRLSQRMGGHQTTRTRTSHQLLSRVGQIATAIF